MFSGFINGTVMSKGGYRGLVDGLVRRVPWMDWWGGVHTVPVERIRKTVGVFDTREVVESRECPVEFGKEDVGEQGRWRLVYP